MILISEFGQRIGIFYNSKHNYDKVTRIDLTSKDNILTQE